MIVITGVFLIVVFCLCLLLRSIYADLVKANERYQAENIKLQLVTFGVEKTKCGVESFFRSYANKRIAIYGVGAVFDVYRKEFEKYGKGIIHQYIDQNDTRKDIEGIPLVKLENIDPAIDLVILTVVYKSDDIKEKIMAYSRGVDVISLAEVIYFDKGV